MGFPCLALSVSRPYVLLPAVAMQRISCEGAAVVGSSQLAYGVCEVPSMKVLTRGMTNEHSEAQLMT